jgi:hypothetical protein
MVTQGYTSTLVAATLAISRSSLYYRKKPRGSRADRSYDENNELGQLFARIAQTIARMKYILPGATVLFPCVLVNPSTGCVRHTTGAAP